LLVLFWVFYPLFLLRLGRADALLAHAILVFLLRFVLECLLGADLGVFSRRVVRTADGELPAERRVSLFLSMAKLFNRLT
jgi:hypothetical protein